MLIASHLENLKESVQDIELAVKLGLMEKQRSLGFHTSAAAADMVEIILHEKKLIDPGFVIKHEWFNSPRAIAEKFPFDFPQKEEILHLVAKIESVRNKLCYGKRQDEKLLEQVLNDFNKLKELFIEVTKYEL